MYNSTIWLQWEVVHFFLGCQEPKPLTLVLRGISKKDNWELSHISHRELYQNYLCCLTRTQRTRSYGGSNRNWSETGFINIWVYVGSCRVYQHRLWQQQHIHRLEFHHLGARHWLHIHGAQLQPDTTAWSPTFQSFELEILPWGSREALLQLACESIADLHGRRDFRLLRLPWYWCFTANFQSRNPGPVSRYCEFHKQYSVLFRYLLCNHQRQYFRVSCAH